MIAVSTRETRETRSGIGLAMRRKVLKRFGVDLETVRAATGRMGWGLLDRSGLVWHSPDRLDPPPRVHLLVDLLRATSARTGLYLEVEPDPGAFEASPEMPGVFGRAEDRAWLAGPAGETGRYLFLLGELR